MNDGDTGYAGAVASKAKKEKFLKPKGEKVEKSESPTNSPPRMSRKKVTRRRRVVIEESEEEVSKGAEHFASLSPVLTHLR